MRDTRFLSPSFGVQDIEVIRSVEFRNMDFALYLDYDKKNKRYLVIRWLKYKPTDKHYHRKIHSWKRLKNADRFFLAILRAFTYGIE